MKTKLLSSFFMFSLLFISCSSDDSDNNDGGMEEVEETLLYYSDISFSFDNSARFFATSTGEMYGESGLGTTALEEIDIVGDSNQAFIAFISPSDDSATSQGGKTTKYQYQNVTLTAAQFDAMTDDSLLKDLTVTDESESLPIDSQGAIVIFENAAGKKGAIKIGSINATRLLVDIKVQK